MDGSALWIAYMDRLLLGCSLMEILQCECPRKVQNGESALSWLYQQSIGSQCKIKDKRFCVESLGQWKSCLIWSGVWGSIFGWHHMGLTSGTSQFRHFWGCLLPNRLHKIGQPSALVPSWLAHAQYCSGSLSAVERGIIAQSSLLSAFSGVRTCDICDEELPALHWKKLVKWSSLCGEHYKVAQRLIFKCTTIKL